MNSSQVRVRFAPSPTGFLHVGGARSALFNYLYAKRFQGKFILRIEDTDTERNKPEYETEILESMKWLGLEWDEGPYYQSKRFDHYRAFVTNLIDAGHAYKCYCTPEEIESGRKRAEAQGLKPMYDRKCRDRHSAVEGRDFCVRFKTPLEGQVVIEDMVRGDVTFDVKEIDDFVILRSNNTPIYNLTVVVDDIEMNISHVIRGEEHLNNAPKQVLLMKAAQFAPPKFAHIPLILAPDKSKLSKRHGAVAVSLYKNEGYLPEALFNYLLRLGWAHGDQEFFSHDELFKIFDVKDVHLAGAVFDVQKLNWMNAQYLQKKDPDQIVCLIKELYSVDLSTMLGTESGKKLLLALRQRAVKLTDFVDQSKWYLSDHFEKDAAAVESIVQTANKPALEKLMENLSQLEPFVSEKIAEVFKETAKSLGLKMPDIAKPARILLTGNLASPDIGVVVEALGKSRTLDRLKSIVSN